MKTFHNKMFFVTVAVLIVCIAGAVFAKKPPADQYLNVAPLPGAGMAMNSLGEPDGQGAMHLNIPVAYTPQKDYFEMGNFAGQWEGMTSISGPGLWRNGSNWIGMGLIRKPRIYASMMANSTILFKDSKSVSFQIQLLEETEKFPALSYGVQDLMNKEREFEDIANTGIAHYGVMTKSYLFKDRPLYATLGYGTAKFRESLIGGLSYSASDSFSTALEYDGFQVNGAVGWRPWGRFSRVTVVGGYNGRCGLLVGLHFTGKLDSAWAVPIGASMLRRWY